MIGVSFLKSKDTRKEAIKKIDNSKADLIHVDLIDGEYVGEKNFETSDIINDLKDVKKLIDIHLMVNNPEKYIEDFAKLRPEIITFHLNTSNNIDKLIDTIKDYNIKVGIALNINELPPLLDPYLSRIDYVLLMGVIPGQGGQKLAPAVLNKTSYFKNKNVMIGIDGGVNGETIKVISKYDLDIVISGSFVCMSDDYDKQIDLLKEALQ